MLELGAEPVVADALDRDAVMRAVTRSEPEVVVHQMTGLAGVTSLKRFDQELAQTNLLRTRGTDNLLEAARTAGVRRLIAQSYGHWAYAGAPRSLKTEADPLDPNPPASMSATLRGIRHLESAVVGAEDIEGLALRYGLFYGPGTGLAPGGPFAELVRRRRLPLIGGSPGVWSFVHVDDAASATVAALTNGAPGVYNVVDDEPAAASVWVPELARILGGKPPRRVPVWLGRLAAGEAGVYLFTRTQGRSNAKAKGELGWQPLHPSWREGFRHGLGAVERPEPVAGHRGGGMS